MLDDRPADPPSRPRGLRARLPRGRTLARYAAVAGIVLVVGGLFARQQLAADDGPDVVTGVLDASVRPVVGGPAPDFALHEAGTGRLVRLSDYRGKTVVLNFWATWCPPCRAEMPDLQDAHAARQARGDLVVIGVDDKEPAGVVTRFTDEIGVTFPVLLDSEGVVRVHYGVKGLPGTFFIDREGVIRAHNLGPVTGGLLPEGIAAADAAGMR